MHTSIDGPASGLFRPVAIRGDVALGDLASAGVSEAMASAAAASAPGGRCVCWGIPFRVGKALVLAGRPVTRKVGPLKSRWLVFLHASDARPLEPNEQMSIATATGSSNAATGLAYRLYVGSWPARAAAAAPVRLQVERPAQSAAAGMVGAALGVLMPTTGAARE